MSGWEPSISGQRLTRFANEPVLALAAYNAGPRRVTEWLALNGDPRGDDPYRLIDWIELIPFAETRNYVQRVLEGRGMYRVALGQPALPPVRSGTRNPSAAPDQARLLTGRAEGPRGAGRCRCSG